MKRKKDSKEIVKKLYVQKDKVLIGCIVFLLLIVMYLFGKNQSLFLGSNQLQQPTQTPTPTIESVIETPTPTTQTTYTDSDPIVSCGPGNNSKQYVKDRQSNCKYYVDCQFSDKTWTFMLKTECDKKQAEQNSETNSANPPSNSSTNRTAVYLTSIKNTFYCSSKNIDAIKDLDAAVVNENKKASDSYGSCLQSVGDYSLCKSDYSQANALGSQLMNLCNQ